MNPRYSLISDYFEPVFHSRAISIYTLGIYLAEGISYAYGGYMAEIGQWRKYRYFWEGITIDSNLKHND